MGIERSERVKPRTPPHTGQKMTPLRRDGRATVLLLIAAAFVTGTTVGLMRFWIANPAPGVESDSQELRAFVIHILVFLVGGMPAVVATLFLARRRPVACPRRTARLAAMGNAPSGVLALFFLPTFIWETPDWLLTALSAFGLGCVTFFIALYFGRPPAAQTGPLSKAVDR